jgi:hypothetical protein
MNYLIVFSCVIGIFIYGLIMGIKIERYKREKEFKLYQGRVLSMLLEKESKELDRALNSLNEKLNKIK